MYNAYMAKEQGKRTTKEANEIILARKVQHFWTALPNEFLVHEIFFEKSRC